MCDDINGSVLAGTNTYLLHSNYNESRQKESSRFERASDGPRCSGMSSVTEDSITPGRRRTQGPRMLSKSRHCRVVNKEGRCRKESEEASSCTRCLEDGEKNCDTDTRRMDMRKERAARPKQRKTEKQRRDASGGSRIVGYGCT